MLDYKNDMEKDVVGLKMQLKMPQYESSMESDAQLDLQMKYLRS